MQNYLNLRFLIYAFWNLFIYRKFNNFRFQPILIFKTIITAVNFKIKFTRKRGKLLIASAAFLDIFKGIKISLKLS